MGSLMCSSGRGGGCEAVVSGGGGVEFLVVVVRGKSHVMFNYCVACLFHGCTSTLMSYKLACFPSITLKII